MQPADLARDVPFGVVWSSERLYRTATGPDPFLGELEARLEAEIGGGLGTRVELDGWEEALRRAWEALVDTGPAVVDWTLAYRAACADRGLVVTFADRSRVVGRRAREYFGVTYPVDLLLAGEDQVAAMRSAVVTVIDRHVRGAGLEVPLFSEVCCTTG